MGNVNSITGKIVGVDIGGTTVTAGVVEENKIISLSSAPVLMERPPEEIFKTIVDTIEDSSKGYSIRGIGAGVPSPAGPETDMLEVSDNLPTMTNFPLRSMLIERYGIPVLLENDSRCMALGEHMAGSLMGCYHCACITLGTGLGCGVIIDGKLYRGHKYFAGEIWNIPLNTGVKLEDTVSASCLKRLFKEKSGYELEPHDIYERYIGGDLDASEVFTEYGEAVGRIIVMVLSFLDPERVAIGGGLSKSYTAFKEGMYRIVEDERGKVAAGKIIPAELPEKAAVIGAAALIERNLKT